MTIGELSGLLRQLGWGTFDRVRELASRTVPVTRPEVSHALAPSPKRVVSVEKRRAIIGAAVGMVLRSRLPLGERQRRELRELRRREQNGAKL